MPLGDRSGGIRGVERKAATRINLWRRFEKARRPRGVASMQTTFVCLRDNKRAEMNERRKERGPAGRGLAGGRGGAAGAGDKNLYGQL